MTRYLDDSWRKSMEIRWDYNNLMQEYVEGDHPAKKVGAITAEDIEKLMPKITRAQASLARKWGKASKMMAWTKLPAGQKSVVADILKTAKRVQDHFESFVVLGIGGSALGPIAVQQALNHMRYNELSREARGGCPRFYVEDNVDPERMASLLDVIDPATTCFNVITKSGSTSETMSQYMIISHLLKEKLGEKWSRHIIATTDKKNGNLVKIAKAEGIKTFVVPDGVGGRFSETCPVGLLPAAVCGIDIEELLAGAEAMDERCKNPDVHTNIGWMAGILMYIAMTQKGKNVQVMMPYADSLKYIADWYCQLWGESLGKKYSLRGKVVHTGQTPVKSLGVTDQHSQVQLYAEGPFDKVITFLKVENYRAQVKIPEECMEYPNVAFLAGHTMNELIAKEQMATEYALTRAGKLNQTIILPEVNAYTLGQLLYLFQVQTAVTGELLGIDAFDQPGVEEGKNATYALFGRPGYEEKRAELEARKAKSENYML